MKLRNCLSAVDKLVPNSFDQDVKIGWINELEAQIVDEIINTHETEDDEDYEFSAYTEDDLDSDLLVPEPYSNVYHRYLEMNIHLENGDFGRYNNAQVLFNNAYLTYQNFYNRTVLPRQNNPYFVV